MNIDKKTFEKLIVEAESLVDRGFDRNVVEEGLFDFLQGTGGTAITQTFKSQMIKFILDELKIVDTKSFLGLAIMNLFANIEFKDYPKLTNCGFVSDQLTKAILETFIDKLRLQGGALGLDQILFVGIQNIITETAANTEAFKSLQGHVSTFICPIVKQIREKFDFSAFTGK